ncbi:MAG: nitroreductase family protein [Clostridia bacterium]|nr:nitroreductase family protein [Clostridia bacterium]
MLALLKKNRSYRRFGKTAVTREQLDTLISAASLTASAANLQQLRFVPVCKGDCALVFPHLRWAGYLPEWDGPVEDERPTGYIVVLCPKQSEGKYLVGVDVGIAAQSILLTATEMGLGGCMFAGIDRDALIPALGLDGKTWAVALVIALGEPCEQVCIVPVAEYNIKYYRDENGVHYVPKRTPQELTVEIKA